MIAKLLGLTLRAPAAIVFGLTLISLVAALGVNRLQVDLGLDRLLPAGDPARATHRQLVDTFGPDQRTVVVLRDRSLWTVQGLQRYQSLHQALAGLATVDRVDSLLSVHEVSVEDGALVTRPIMAGLPDTADRIDRLRERVTNHSRVQGRLVSAGSDHVALSVTLDSLGDDPDAAQHSRAAIESILNAVRTPGIELFQFSAAHTRHGLQAALTRDLLILAPVAALVVALVMLLGLRCGVAALLPLLSAGLTVLWTLGVMGWAGLPLTLFSGPLLALILIAGSSEDAHLVAAFLRGLPATGSGDRRAAAYRMLQVVGLPILLTIATTTLAVAATAASPLPLLREFALAAAAAVFVNGVVTLLVAPPLLAALGPAQAPGDLGQDTVPPIGRRMAALFEGLRQAGPLWLFAMLGALCLFLAPQLGQLKSGSDPLMFLPSDSTLARQAATLDDAFGGSRSFSVVVDAGREQAFLQPGAVRRLARIQQAMRDDGVFVNSESFADHLSAVHLNLRGAYGAVGEQGLPETPDMVAQAMLFMHRAELAPVLSQDASQARIIVRHSVRDPGALTEHLVALQDRARHLAGPNMAVHITGHELLMQQVSGTLIPRQFMAFGVLLVLFYGLTAMLCTSWRVGLLMLVPTALPVLVVFGALGLAGVPLNPVSLLVVLVAAGLAVDGALHLLVRCVDCTQQSGDPILAVSRALQERATPMVIGGVSSMLGFATLALSGITPVVEFGLIAAACMAVALFANLIVLPQLMARFRLVGLHQILGQRIDPSVLSSSALLQGMTSYQRRKALVIAQCQTFSSGSLLMRQGARERSMFLILDGTASVVRHDAGAQREVAKIGAGDLVGEVAFIRPTERTADVRATSDVTALQFDHERLQRDLRFFPSLVARLNLNISLVLGMRLAELMENRPPPG